MIRPLLAITLAALAGAAEPPVEKSIVTLPEQAGVFVHERSHIETKTAPNWVSADYGAPRKRGDPWLAVRIVPNLRASEAEAVAALAQGFEDSLRNNRAMIHLAELPPRSIRVGDSLGNRQSFTYMDRDGQDTRHAGLVFHRQLFDIELRVRMASEDISQAKFDALADSAAREVLPKLGLQNFGSCAGLGPQDNCTRLDAGAPDPAPLPGVQHVLVHPASPAPQ